MLRWVVVPSLETCSEKAELTLSFALGLSQRLIGDRSYKAMFTRYKFRVFIAMSAQAFAQLVSSALLFRFGEAGEHRVCLRGRGDFASLRDSQLIKLGCFSERYQRHLLLCAPRL